MRAAIDANAIFLTEITGGKLFEDQYDTVTYASDVAGAQTDRADLSSEGEDRIISSTFDMGKVRSTLRQYAREWSIEGEMEREQSFGRLLRYMVTDPTRLLSTTRHGPCDSATRWLTSGGFMQRAGTSCTHRCAHVTRCNVVHVRWCHRFVALRPL